MKNEAGEPDCEGKDQEQERAGFFDWLFRSRATGRIALVQVPNLPLVVWFLASAVGRPGLLAGQSGKVLEVVAASALLLWAVLELATGVNPFRRALGLAVLLWTLFT